MKYNVPTENNVNFEYKQETSIPTTEEKVPASALLEQQLMSLIQKFAKENQQKVSDFEVIWERDENREETDDIDKISIYYKSTRKS